MTFFVPQADWDDAIVELKGQPSGTKLDKYPFEPSKNFKAKWIQLRKRSFVILDEVIYALSNKEDSALKKFGQTIFGDQVVIEKTKNGSPKYKLASTLSLHFKTIFDPSKTKENVPQEQMNFVKNSAECNPPPPAPTLIFSQFQQAAQLPDLFLNSRKAIIFPKPEISNALKQTDANIKNPTSNINRF